MDSSQSSSKESDDLEDAGSDNADPTRKDFKSKNVDTNYCPFKLEWSLGINSKVPLINLTTKNRTMIAYSCSHAVMILDYETKETLALQGHQNEVKSLSVSKDGKWLVSADFEEDAVVVVWNTEKGLPICSLFNPHGEHRITAARISPNAKYIVTIGNERCQIVYFWLWTYGRAEPDASIELTETTSSRVKDIVFSEEFPEDFLLTTEKNVIFMTWRNSKLTYHCPKIRGKTYGLGDFNCSCYSPETQQSFTATTNGFVLVFEIPSGHSETYDTEKSHYKSVKLQQYSINVILQHDGIIVTGNSAGIIRFYDPQLRLLFWCRNSDFHSISSISFDLQSRLVGPVTIISESHFEFGEEDDTNGEEFTEEDFSDHTEVQSVDGRVENLNRSQQMHEMEKIPSKLSVNLEPRLRNYNSTPEIAQPPHVPTDATLNRAPFHVANFFICTSNGIIALIDIPRLKCHFIKKNPEAPITCLDSYPESDYLITGDKQGLLCLYDYKKHGIIVSRKMPPLPNFRSTLDWQVKNDLIIYITCPESYGSLIAISTLKYSPKCDMLACGMENGALWLLHPITLLPLDPTPYKHSTESILKVIFTMDAEYMAYSDNTLVVAVFKRSKVGPHIWDFIGKYRSHYMMIRDIVFGPPAAENEAPRFLSLGEDRDLIEYDLENSGPYPDPGLKILQIDQIEYSAIPYSLDWYPNPGAETFLIISNSEHKYRLLNDITKKIRGTYLGPTFGAPVKKLKILSNKTYMIFVTDKEIGLQLLHIDGNPYKILGIIGHPTKITNFTVNHDEKYLFTSGHKDSCILMWKIKYRSVNIMAQLGGASLSPFYGLIEGGKKGWLITEMQDLFYYAQILHQGENTTSTRIVSDKVITKQIPNLMRAIGFFPTNEEVEIIMGEVSYKNYAETGRLVQEITFEDFVKLYINHRPVFGISLRQMKEAFETFQPLTRRIFFDDTSLTREQFVDILYGKGPEGFRKKNDIPFGEPLTLQQAYSYLKLLLYSENQPDDLWEEKRPSRNDFNFLPKKISYKDFAMDIMGIELPEETRADKNN